MTSFKFCVASAAILAVLPGCGSDESTPTVPPLGMDEAPVLVDAALGSLALRSALIDNQISPDAIMNTNPGSRWVVARPIYKFLQDLDITLPNRETACITDATKWVDADGDGIPVGYAVSFNCHDKLGAAFSYSIQGKVSVNDHDDADPASGFDMTWAGFSVDRSYFAGGNLKGLSLDGTLKLTRSDNYLTLSENTVVRTRNQKGVVVQSGTLRSAELVGYKPDDIGNPFAAGTVTWLAANTFESGVLTHRLRVQTDPTLHFQEACRVGHPGRAGWDGGAVVYTDGSTLRIQYSSCDAMTVTLDGVPVPL